MATRREFECYIVQKEWFIIEIKGKERQTFVLGCSSNFPQEVKSFRNYKDGINKPILEYSSSDIHHFLELNDVDAEVLNFTGDCVVFMSLEGPLNLRKFFEDYYGLSKSAYDLTRFLLLLLEKRKVEPCITVSKEISADWSNHEILNWLREYNFSDKALKDFENSNLDGSIFRMEREELRGLLVSRKLSSIEFLIRFVWYVWISSQLAKAGSIISNFTFIPSDEIEEGENIYTEGASGVVKICKWRGKEYAIKIYNNSSCLLEVVMLGHASHEHIVEIIGIVDSEERPVSFLMELCDMDLKKAIENNLQVEELCEEKKYSSLVKKKEIALGVARALHHIHHLDGFKIFHRDVKLDNILINEQNGHMIPKLSDLGFSTFTKKGDNTIKNTYIDPGDSIAPDVIKGDYNSSVDIYNFGVVLLQLVSESVSAPKELEKLSSDSVDEHIDPSQCPVHDLFKSSEMTKLVDKMLRTENRPNSQFVLEKLNGMDPSDFEAKKR